MTNGTIKNPESGSLPMFSCVSLDDFPEMRLLDSSVNEFVILIDMAGFPSKGCPFLQSSPTKHDVSILEFCQFHRKYNDIPV